MSLVGFNPGICLQVLKNAMKLPQDTQSPGRGLNRDPPEYEAEVLPTRPRR
jgi:hypothetical protein